MPYRQQQRENRRLRRRGSKTSLQRRLRRAHLQEPWWYVCMRQSGLVPEGVKASKEIGYPVILPSRQSVYILPTAVNAHLARTYPARPLETVEEADEDASTVPSCASSSSSGSACSSCNSSVCGEPHYVDFDTDEFDWAAPPLDLSFIEDAERSADLEAKRWQEAIDARRQRAANAASRRNSVVVKDAD